MDETTLGLHPVLSACWTKRGQQKRIDTPGQQQWHHLFGAYNFLTDEVITLPSPTKNSEAFAAFLDTLVQQVTDDRPIVLVLDNASYHRSAVATAAFTAWEERIVPCFLPPYCSTLNPIERYWRHLKQQACANTLFPTMFALILSVVMNLAYQNDLSNPERFTTCKNL